ncbi:hypothetical protein J3U21_01435 [Gilliamella sp. B2776]|uniref:LuxE/PaaK family acyltransferase n=1 Tax=unclassified Gilliamella TaxID=2685620 RepID=UPI00226A79B3|nr:MULTISPECIES: hypothetical protein [unclassified Gilliamella]MCX8648997.1 hypothetical protein [Gilliamella sp. B2779]MCX8653127.1 hypothetical protein [Gilliamella sp. B2737]MCX8655387.1 hypothetical protein [Gilliamella sp. B2894]MCX8664152.1 hypothetical protein [Gilliamella sp. B2887]MCX8690809.1 hypothetical protein [Gilliamella sp. B2776]
MQNIASLYSEIKMSGFDPLRLLIADVDKLYKLSESEQKELKLCLIKDTVTHHFENNPYYKKICEEQNFTPSNIKVFEDLTKIPLIPVSVFKSGDNYKLLSKPLQEIEHEMRSTGTSGIPSVYRRCHDTMTNTAFAVVSNYRSMFQISTGAGLFLCPSPEDVPEMAMVKIFNFLTGLLDTRYYALGDNYEFDAKKSIEALMNWENKFSRHIIGPPFLINRFITYLKTNNIKLKLDSQSLVIMMGGWKRFTGEMISRKELNQDIETWLGIPSSNVRDMYGMVEANFMAIEDEFNHKHVPPYIHFSVRDPNDLSKEVPDGEVGQLAIFDPLSLSVPAMIQTEDLVFIRNDETKSWRNSQRIEFVSRTPTAKEFGCCAVTLEKNMNKNDVCENAKN